MSAFLTSRRLRWLLVVAASLSAIGLFLLATATENRERFARGYDTLVVINIATVALLMFIVGWQLRRLRRSRSKPWSSLSIPPRRSPVNGQWVPRWRSALRGCASEGISA